MAKKSKDNGDETDTLTAEVKTEFQRAYAEVQRLKDMTDTLFWGTVSRQMQLRRLEHAEAILVDEQTRKMVQHQEAIKAIDAIRVDICEPLTELNRMRNEVPLLIEDVDLWPMWDENTWAIKFHPSAVVRAEIEDESNDEQELT